MATTYKQGQKIEKFAPYIIEVPNGRRFEFHFDGQYYRAGCTRALTLADLIDQLNQLK